MSYGFAYSLHVVSKLVRLQFHWNYLNPTSSRTRDLSHCGISPELAVFASYFFVLFYFSHLKLTDVDISPLRATYLSHLVVPDLFVPLIFRKF